MKIYKVFDVETTTEENNMFMRCNIILDTIITDMVENNCNALASETTGEVISLNELKRMRGILGGFPNITFMYYSDKE